MQLQPPIRTARRQALSLAPGARILETWFRHRSTALLALVFPIAVWACTAQLPRPSESWLGAMLVVAGAWLRLASIRVLGRGARVHRADLRGGLAVSGPYAWTRNPLYLAAGLVLAGLAFHAGLGWSAALLLPATALVYTPVVLAEERAIGDSAASDFAAYARAVPRWIGLRHAPPARDVARLPWSDVLRRESLLVPGLLVAWIGIWGVRAAVPALEGTFGVPVRALPLALTIGLGVALGAAANSVSIEWKRRRRARRREAVSGA